VSDLSEETLSKIHESLASELLTRIQEGTATPTDLNVARQMLKDNNITISPAASSPLVNILEELPYDEKGSIIDSEEIRKSSSG